MRLHIKTTYYAPERSGNAPYVTGLAEFLAERGHDVTVATGFPHYPYGSHGHAMRFGARECLKDVRVVRRNHYVPARQSAATRGVYELSLLASGMSSLLAGPRPDVVIGVMPTLAAGCLAAATASVWRAPLVLALQDVQGLGAVQSGVRNGARVADTVSYLEEKIWRRASQIGVVAEGFRRHLTSAGVAPERIRRIRNWPIYTEPTVSREEARRALGWREQDFVCLHAGNMGHKQDLGSVLDAAAELPEGSRIRFVLAGGGNERQQLEAKANRLGVRNVSFLDSLPGGGSWEALLVAADVLLVNQRLAVSDMSLPSKLATYFAAGRPVLAAVSTTSEAAMEVRASAAGVVIEPGDPGGMARALLRLSAVSLSQFGDAGRRYAEQILSRTRALRDIEAMVIDAASERSGSTYAALGGNSYIEGS